ncbi:hypothetical protein D3C72_1620280 [compost metagenome]
MPAVSTFGINRSVPGYQGRGKGEKARAVTPITARPARTMLCGFGCEAEEMMTGTQSSGANGLASPPVMKSRPVSCARSSPRSAKAAGGRNRCVGGKRSVR